MYSFPTVSKFSSRLNPKFRSLVLDDKATYFEEAVYHLFMVDPMDLISIKAQLCKAFSIQPSEIDKMAFWEFELFTKELERLVKDENEQQKSEMDKSGVKNAMKMTKPGAMQNMMKNSMPKMPDFKMPSTIKMPTMSKF